MNFFFWIEILSSNRFFIFFRFSSFPRWVLNSPSSPPRAQPRAVRTKFEKKKKRSNYFKFLFKTIKNGPISIIFAFFLFFPGFLISRQVEVLELVGCEAKNRLWKMSSKCHKSIQNAWFSTTSRPKIDFNCFFFQIINFVLGYHIRNLDPATANECWTNFSSFKKISKCRDMRKFRIPWKISNFKFRSKCNQISKSKF